MTSLCLLLAQIARTGSCLLFMADSRDVCSWSAFEPARAEAERRPGIGAPNEEKK